MFFLNLEKSYYKFIDPITFIHSLYQIHIIDKFLHNINYKSSKEVYPIDYNYVFYVYVKNRNKKDSSLLWKLALALYKGKKWKKLFKKAYNEVYSVDIEDLSRLAYFLNPKKFKFIYKVDRLSGYSSEERIKQNSYNERY